MLSRSGCRSMKPSSRPAARCTTAADPITRFGTPDTRGAPVLLRAASWSSVPAVRTTPP